MAGLACAGRCIQHSHGCCSVRLLFCAAVIFECEGGPQPEPPANAADNKKAKPAPWEVCEMYGPGECSDNKDRCSLCENKASGKALCFDPKIASKLPDCEPAHAC